MSYTETHEKVSASACPNCGKTLDAATSTTDADHRPSVGDVSVCFMCGEALRFGEGLTLERLDLDTVSPEVRAELERIQSTLRSFRYNLACEATARAVKTWLDTYPAEPIRIALPPKDIGVIADLRSVGKRIARSKATLVFLKGLCDASEEQHLDTPTIFMLQAALEHYGIEIERVSLAELGLVQADKASS